MKRRRKRRNKKSLVLSIIMFIIVSLLTYYKDDIDKWVNKSFGYNYSVSYDISSIPEYNGQKYVYINDNEPDFNLGDMVDYSYEEYSDLDYLGRCGEAMANIGKDLMPTTERESIGSVKPSGWQISKYDFIDGKYLYNRCHLIGYQLAGENANPKNLITCTRTMNASTMLEFENKVANYVKKTNNHVLYRVTPIFYDDNLIASGVEMEALSVEDNGRGIKFHVFIYNVEDNIEIDYKTGNNKLKEAN